MRHLVFIIASVLLTTPALADNAETRTSDADSSRVVVSQGGVDLTLSDVDGYAMSIPADKRAAVFNDPESIESILRGMLVTKQLAREARQLELQKQADVQAQLERAKELVLSKARTEALRTDTENNVPDMTELASERYMANPTAFDVPAEVDVKHILVSTDDRNDADARAIADKLYANLIKHPEQFDADVEKYSDDKSKGRNHGLIENANSSRLVQEFRAAASNLTKVGEIVGPIKTAYGYHIIKAVKLVPAQPRSFAQVKTGLIEKMRRQWIAETVQHHIDALRSDTLDADPDLVAALRSRYLEAATEKSFRSGSGTDKTSAAEETPKAH